MIDLILIYGIFDTYLYKIIQGRGCDTMRRNQERQVLYKREYELNC